MSISIAVDQRLAKKRSESEREREGGNKKRKTEKKEKSSGLPLKAWESIKALKGT